MDRSSGTSGVRGVLARRSRGGMSGWRISLSRVCFAVLLAFAAACEASGRIGKGPVGAVDDADTLSGGLDVVGTADTRVNPLDVPLDAAGDAAQGPSDAAQGPSDAAQGPSDAAQDPSDAAQDAGDDTQGPPGDTQGPPLDVPVGPQPCASPADCAPGCVAGAKDCTCAQTPQGMACIPTCVVDADCPKPPDKPLVCNLAQHLCRPAEGPPGP